jgi:hypothetical protein
VLDNNQGNSHALTEKENSSSNFPREFGAFHPERSEPAGAATAPAQAASEVPAGVVRFGAVLLPLCVLAGVMVWLQLRALRVALVE